MWEQILVNCHYFSHALLEFLGKFTLLNLVHKRLTVCVLLFIEASGRKNIVLNHAALADREGMLQLKVYDNQSSGWSTLADRPLENYGIDIKSIAVEEVQAMTIDAYCQQRRVSHIDLLKIDVEGAEFKVLLSVQELLHQRRICCCIFEF